MKEGNPLNIQIYQFLNKIYKLNSLCYVKLSTICTENSIENILIDKK